MAGKIQCGAATQTFFGSALHSRKSSPLLSSPRLQVIDPGVGALSLLPHSTLSSHCTVFLFQALLRSPSISLARSLTLLPCPSHFCTHAQTHACVHVCMHACSYIHTYIHTQTNAYAHTHKHTHTHTHTISHEDVAVIVHRKGAAWSERCIRVSLRRAEKERSGALLPPRHLSPQPLKGFSPATRGIIPPPMPGCNLHRCTSPPNNHPCPIMDIPSFRPMISQTFPRTRRSALLSPDA